MTTNDSSEDSLATSASALARDEASVLMSAALKMASDLESSAKFYAEVADEMDTENYEPDYPVDIQAGLENQAKTCLDAAKMIRALLAPSSAATAAPSETQEADDDIEECREILLSLMRNIQEDGHYSIEATCTFIQQAINCLPTKV